MRNYLSFYINNELVKVDVNDSAMTLANYLRKKKSLTGTKIVCAEGDCGACTVLIKKPFEEKLPFRSINSCIAPLYLLDSCQVITVEGIEEQQELNEIQTQMINHQGSQCGYCTPGFICALAGMTEEVSIENKNITEQRIKNHTTGNLCRCTGYLPIIEAAKNIDLSKIKTFEKRYYQVAKEKLHELAKETIQIEAIEESIFMPTTLEEALIYKNTNEALINSGGTDVGVWINKRDHQAKKVLILNKIQKLYEYEDNKQFIKIGSKVTIHEAADMMESTFPEFSRKMNIFASPQIKNKGTIIGNLANGSPIGDSIPFMLVSDSILNIASVKKNRDLPLKNFYLGYKKFDLAENEIITSITIPKTNSDFKLYKVSARKDLDISSVTMAFRYQIEHGVFKDLKIAIGGVGPTVYINEDIESRFLNQPFEISIIEEMANEYLSKITPMSDLRGSAKFRKIVVKNLFCKFFDEVYLTTHSNSEACI